MTYAKIPKITHDSCIGIRAINQASDNELALIQGVFKRHGLDDGTSLQNPLTRTGRHVDINIARTILGCKVVGDTLETNTVGPLIQFSAFRQNPGVWILNVALWGNSIFSARATPQATTTAHRMCACFKFGASQYRITTFELISGVFNPTDFNFDLAFWAA